MPFALALAGISFVLAVIWGSQLIQGLVHYGIGKRIRVEGPQSHMIKMGTPTMGGILILIPVLALTVALNLLQLLAVAGLAAAPADEPKFIGRSILLPIFVMVSFGVLGGIDDISGIRQRPGQGLYARTKLAWQGLLGLLASLILYFLLDIHSVGVPFVREPVDLGWLYVPIATFIIVGTSNAVNLTDGLDGLAGLTAATTFLAYGIVAQLQGQTFLLRFCFTMVGACFAFLWYNVHPAELFMGDTGSLAIGATLGVVALMTRQWLLLPLIGLIFVAEAISVMLQIGYYKLSKGKRLFKMAPLHHHFELLGWSETQVVQRFWLIQLLAAMIGIALALI